MSVLPGVTDRDVEELRQLTLFAERETLVGLNHPERYTVPDVALLDHLAWTARARYEAAALQLRDRPTGTR
jgi:hypothetical protein